MSEVSFLATVKAQSSGSLSLCLVLGSVGVSYFHETCIGLVRLVGVSLVVGPGAVKVHGHHSVVHVLRGIRQVISLVWVPLLVPVVVWGHWGVLLKVLVGLAGSVVVLATLKELAGLSSPSCQHFEYLLCFSYIDCHVLVLAVGGVGDHVGRFKYTVKYCAGEAH